MFKLILPVYVYRVICSRADMGVGECVCTLADIDFTSKSKTHLGMLTNIESSVADLAFTARVYLYIGCVYTDIISVVWFHMHC